MIQLWKSMFTCFLTNVRNVLLLQEIQLMIDKMGASMMKNAKQTLSMVKFLLLYHEGKHSENDYDNITMALGLLSTLIVGVFGNEQEQGPELNQRFEDLVPVLQRYTKHPLPEIAEMVSTALLSIQSKEYSSVKEQKEDEDAKIKAKLHSILADLRDPLLPVRAHGVQTLRELILQKNPKLQTYMKQIMSIFQVQLKDEDSYVYLAAIHGLEAMGDVYPDQVIPMVIKTYLNASQALEVEDVIKVGESLVKIAERTGQVLPKYASQFMNCMLSVCRGNFKHKFKSDDANQDAEHNALFRASALSNLASLCELLKFAVHPYLQEVIECTCTILQSNSEHVLVQRQCVHIIQRLVYGFQTHLFDFLPEHVQRITHSLQTAQFYNADQLIKHNSQIVLEDLEQLYLERLKPKHDEHIITLKNK